MFIAVINHNDRLVPVVLITNNLIVSLIIYVDSKVQIKIIKHVVDYRYLQIAKILVLLLVLPTNPKKSR